MHENEHFIDESLVKQLLIAQFPQWADLPLSQVRSDGTVNAIYRLGHDLCVRLPRIPEVDHQIEIEHEWLPQLAPHLPFPIPSPVAKGKPTEQYPWHWSVNRWLVGETFTARPVSDLRQSAIDLAEFIKALHLIPANGGPLSHRSGPLITQDIEARAAIQSLGTEIDSARVTELWLDCLKEPAWDKAPVWIHGDLLPANLLTHHGHLSAVIDFDLFGVGDPACDLIPAWSLLDANSREVFRTRLEVDDATWKRGQGWALSIGLIILPYYKHTNRGLYTVGERMVREVLAGSRG